MSIWMSNPPTCFHVYVNVPVILNELGPIIDGAQGTEAALILRCEVYHRTLLKVQGYVCFFTSGLYWC